MTSLHYWLEARETNAEVVTIYLHQTEMGKIMRSSDPTIDEDVTTCAHAAREMRFYRQIVDDLNARCASGGHVRTPAATSSLLATETIAGISPTLAP
jgi:hypothetical protein